MKIERIQLPHHETQPRLREGANHNEWIISEDAVQLHPDQHKGQNNHTGYQQSSYQDGESFTEEGKQEHVHLNRAQKAYRVDEKTQSLDLVV